MAASAAALSDSPARRSGDRRRRARPRSSPGSHRMAKPGTARPAWRLRSLLRGRVGEPPPTRCHPLPRLRPAHRRESAAPRARPCAALRRDGTASAAATAAGAAARWSRSVSWRDGGSAGGVACGAAGAISVGATWSGGVISTMPIATTATTAAAATGHQARGASQTLRSGADRAPRRGGNRRVERRRRLLAAGRAPRRVDVGIAMLVGIHPVSSRS